MTQKIILTRNVREDSILSARGAAYTINAGEDSAVSWYDCSFWIISGASDSPLTRYSRYELKNLRKSPNASNGVR